MPADPLAAAAARRGDYVRALREERAGCERVGKAARVAAIDDELARVEGRPLGRSETPPDDAPRARRPRKSEESA